MAAALSTSAAAMPDRCRSPSEADRRGRRVFTSGDQARHAGRSGVNDLPEIAHNAYFAKVSALRHYNLAGSSMKWLITLLSTVDQDVELVMSRSRVSTSSSDSRGGG